MIDKALEGIQQLSAPISVFLNLTKQCNMRCIYCYAETVRPARESADDELTDEEFLDLVDQLTAAKVFRYALSGGEPFMRRDLVFDILDRVTRVGHVMLFTNGTLIRPQDARRLAGYLPRLTVYLSIDAPDEETNAITRGRGYLAKTLRGAHRLMDAGIVPEVNCVLSRTNYRRIPELLKFIRGEGFRRIHIIHLQPLGYAEEMARLGLERDQRLWFNREIFQIVNSQDEVDIIAQDDLTWRGFEEIYCQQVERGLTGGAPARLLPCSAGAEQANITADGWVTPCNYMLSYRCGNVREQPFLDIWRNSPQLATLRALRQTPVTAVDECAECNYNTFCRGGCRAIAYAKTQDLLGFDPTCPHREGVPLWQAPEKSLLPVVA